AGHRKAVDREHHHRLHAVGALRAGHGHPRPATGAVRSEADLLSEEALPRFDVKGQVALVTGAARGIGRACALALAQAGADVALPVPDGGSGAALADEMEALGRRTLRLQMDVTRLGEVRAAIAAAVRHFGRLDILVNNAGIAPENPAERVREE